MKSIIVGTDFSRGSYVALDLAVDIANKLGCGIKIIWAKREKLLFDEEQLTVMTHLAEEKLEMLCDQHRPNLHGGEIRWEICSGKVGAIIARQARHENAPLIVIGTNGASGFEKYWMGSTAVRIVQEAPVPVLTVRQGYDFHKALERIVQKQQPVAREDANGKMQMHLKSLSCPKQDRKRAPRFPLRSARCVKS